MPANSTHPKYDAALPRWQRCIDAYGGSDTIKAATITYLPLLTTQHDDQYKAYLNRALFYGATERTVQGLTGASIARPFECKLPTRLKHMEKEATPNKGSLQSLVKTTVLELLKTGRLGLLVDRGTYEGNKPYIVNYDATQITNWQETDGVPTLITLKECVYEKSADDAYVTKEVEQWRELRIEDGSYKVILWRKKVEQGVVTDELVPVNTIVPLQRGKPLTAIPFVVINADGIGLNISKPPLLSVVDVNISHYQNSADLEHGRHLTGLPTPVVTGAELKPGETLLLGSSKAWIFKNDNADAKFLEFTGQGLGSLVTALTEKERMMAVLGARLLEGQKASVEAAETVRLRGAGDTYTLGSINTSAADGLSLALSYADQWEGGDGNVTMEPNLQFVDTKLSAEDITALLGAFNSSAISLETFLWNLQHGERLQPDSTVEQELVRIGKERDNAADDLPQLTPEEQAAAAEAQAAASAALKKRKE